MYRSEYKDSWAICIGINKYENVSPLEYARNDAQAFGKTLVEEFSFDSEHVKILVDEQATKENILRSYLDFSFLADDDDRVVFFFAGHGETVEGNRGNIGYLIPFDAKDNDLSSFIRWDELTKNSEVIRAKHLLFIIDACFSGLAVNRSLSKVRNRFVKDMLQRYTRQALAAGKANQPVSDGNGPINGHSIFTGHLLNGLRDSKIRDSGVLSANSLMQYVYQKVSADPNSYQTPHFGFLDGDGDLLFCFPEQSKSDDKYDSETLYEVPASSDSLDNPKELLLKTVKNYLSEEKYYIRLDDLIVSELRVTLGRFLTTEFDYFNQVTENTMLKCLSDIDLMFENLNILIIAICNWGKSQHKKKLKVIFSRIYSVTCKEEVSYKIGKMKCFPLISLFYSAGICLVYNRDFETLYELIKMEITPHSAAGRDTTFIRKYYDAYTELDYSKYFKQIEAHKRHYVPLSEYLFIKLQASLEDVIYIGDEYEIYFDEFETIVALQSAYQGLKNTEHLNVPLGRFGWKYSSRFSQFNPISHLYSRAENYKDQFDPIKAGLFGGDLGSFKATFSKVTEYLSELNWH